MATYTFPADGFMIQGDPEAVRESGRAYRRFATTAAQAPAGLRGLDAGAWARTAGQASTRPHMPRSSRR